MNETQRIAVIRGGSLGHYGLSMRAGQDIIDSLNYLNYPVVDVVITKTGEWLIEGRAKNTDTALESIDVVFLALHGDYAEDGQIQKILRRKSIPYTGSDVFSSSLTYNKALTKESLKKHGILMPESVSVSKFTNENLVTIVNNIKVSFGPEYILKPVAGGSSVGIRLVRDKFSLYETLLDMLDVYDNILVEEYIRGKEATTAVLEWYRNQNLYVFPVLEVVPENLGYFYDYDSKNTNSARVFCPARFSYEERQQLADTASLTHKELGLSQYSRSDFIVRDGEVYFLEINSLPELSKKSLYTKAIESVGMSHPELVKHLLENAKV